MTKEQNVEGLNVSPAIAKPMLPAVSFPSLDIDGMKSFKSKVMVGDLICNHWASEQNPQRVGIFIGFVTRQGMKCVELTDEKGSKRWHPIFDRTAKLEIIGSIRNSR